MTEVDGETRAMLEQVQDFLRDLEKLGLAESCAESMATASMVDADSASTTTFQSLPSLARYFGYRLA